MRFCRKFPTTTGRKSLLKSGRLPNLIGDSGNKTREFSVSLL